MNDPLISVLVPVYKTEAYLTRCVSSICNQTYKNLEIILVDDGSPDGSGALCDQLALEDSRIRVIHKENGGLASTRNVGIDAMNGEYVAFIDSDESVFMSAADIASVFQAEYTYNSEEDSITYVLGKKLFGKKEAVLTAEANTAMVNGKQIDWDAAPVVSDDLLLVPMEAQR